MKEQYSAGRGECCNDGFGKEVIGRETNSEDPVGKISGCGNVVRSGQESPSAEEVGEDGNADWKTAKEISAEWNPGYQSNEG